MTKLILLLTLVVVVSLWLVIPAFAAPPAAPLGVVPVGNCKRGFSRELLSNHVGVPNKVDHNGDGYICILDRGPAYKTIYSDNYNKIRCRR